MSETLEQPAPQDSATDAASLFAAPTSAENTTADSPNDTESVLAPGTPVDENAELLKLLPADDDTEEIDYEGKKFRVPKEARDAFMRQQDYTRKTQEVAEHRRALEQQAAAVQRQHAFHQSNIAEVAKLVSLDNQLQQYAQLDWNKLIAEEPQRAMALDRQMRDLQGQKAQIAQGLTQKQQQQALYEQQEIAKRTQDGQRELERDIKGWSPELAGKLLAYGASQGFKPEVLSNVREPAFVKLLHKAHQYDQLLAQRTAKPAAAPLPKPVTKVGGGGATNTKQLSDLSPEEWATKRAERRNQPRRF